MSVVGTSIYHDKPLSQACDSIWQMDVIQGAGPHHMNLRRAVLSGGSRKGSQRFDAGERLEKPFMTQRWGVHMEGAPRGLLELNSQQERGTSFLHSRGTE